MKKIPTKSIEQWRITQGRFASDKSFGANGAFQIPHNLVSLRIIVSDGTDWKLSGLPGIPFEHVSVSLAARCPTWEEMDFVKRIFWRDDETVFQLHVARENWINNHKYCLHLWKPVGIEIPLPPNKAVGLKEPNI